MDIITKLLKRILKVFFRDKSTVFFSFLSVLIIIAMYAFFLAKVQIQGIESQTGNVEGVRFLVDSWIMSGLLAVNAVTLCLGALGIMVRDNETKYLDDFLVSPIKRKYLIISYLLGTLIIASILSIVAFLLGEIYIVASGGEFLDFVSMAKALAVVLLSVFTSASVMLFVASFLKSINAFSTLSIIMGTMIGFLTGVYVPIGILPAAVKNFIMAIPFSHSAVLLREIFMEKPISMVFVNAPKEVMDDYLLSYGVKMFFAGTELSSNIMILYVAGVGLLFLLLSIFKMARMKR